MRTMERTHREGGHCGPSFVLYLVERKGRGRAEGVFPMRVFCGD